MLKRLVILAGTAFCLWSGSGVRAWADVITQIPIPTKAYLDSTTLITFGGADGTLFNQIMGGGLTVVFDDKACPAPPAFSAPCVVKLSVPDTWGTWNCPPFTETACVHRTPKDLPLLWSGEWIWRVIDGRLVIVGVKPIDIITMTLKTPEFVFGFEAEPDSSTIDNMTATYYMGAKKIGSIDLKVDGNGGARLFAVSSKVAFDKVVVVDTAMDDFALANIRFADKPLPEPGSLLLLGSGLVGLGLRKLLKNP